MFYLKDVNEVNLQAPFPFGPVVMCCQPQQKSDRKQPETNGSLPLQGMLCFLFRETKKKMGFKGGCPQINSKNLNICQVCQENKTRQRALSIRGQSFFSRDDLTCQRCQRMVLLSFIVGHVVFKG